MDQSRITQVIMATHSPLLMAYPVRGSCGSTAVGLEPITVEETDHYRLMREFWADPRGFVDALMTD